MDSSFFSDSAFCQAIGLFSLLECYRVFVQVRISRYMPFSTGTWLQQPHFRWHCWFHLLIFNYKVVNLLCKRNCYILLVWWKLVWIGIKFTDRNSFFDGRFKKWKENRMFEHFSSWLVKSGVSLRNSSNFILKDWKNGTLSRETGLQKCICL